MEAEVEVYKRQLERWSRQGYRIRDREGLVSYEVLKTTTCVCKSAVQYGLSLLFISSSERLRLDDLDLLQRPVALIRPSTPNLIHHLHATHHLAKHGMLAIQMRRGCQGDEELAPVCAWSTVRHGEDALLGVTERVVELVLELAAEDGLAAAAGAGGVAALDHEVGDDAVEDDVVVSASVGEAGEVLAGL